MHSGSGGDASLLVDGPINVESLKGRDGSRGEEESFYKGWVDEVSSCPTVYEGSSCDSSCSVS